MIEFFVISSVMIGLIFLLSRGEHDEKNRKYEEDVSCHMQNLLKGGLIPRADRAVHNEACRRIADRHPHIQLPKARYFWNGLDDEIPR